MKYLLLMLISFSICSCIQSGGEDYSHRNEAGFNIICVRGHQYYKGWSGYQGYMAIRLTDDGKPIKCGEKKECAKTCTY